MRIRRRGDLLLLAFALLPGCSCDPSSGPEDTVDATPIAPDAEAEPYPVTCAEIRALHLAETGEDPANGTYTLYVDGEASKPWDVYCHGMDQEAPTEYLSLDESANFSSSSSGSAIVETSFRRLRIDPSTLKLDPLDDTFADTSDTEGLEDLLPVGRAHLPAGWARFVSPNADDGPPGTAQIDLSGTGFVFHEDILADDLAFFCTVQEVEPGTGVGEIEVASDLASFTLTAINPAADAWIRVVCDCDGLGGDDAALTSAAWPLQYVGP